MKSGIYEILNTSTLIRYIGSAKDLKKRLGDHKTNLKRNRHANRHLQSSYNKHGLEAFEFNIIEYCDEHNLLIREQKHIDSYKFKSLYNLRPKASNNLGLKMSDESKQRQSEGHKKAGLNSGNFEKGVKPWNKDTKGEMVAWNKGVERPFGDPWNKNTKGIMKSNKASFKPKGEIELVKGSILYKTILGAVFLGKQLGISSTSIYNIQKGHIGITGFRLPIEGETYTQVIEFTPQTKS